MRCCLLIAVVALSSTAFADRRELYIELEAGLGAQLLVDSASEKERGLGLGVGGQLEVLYGLTNPFHIGLYARGLFAPDVAFPGVTPTLMDGSMPTGTLYSNAFGAGGGALIRWRFDTGYFVAPIAQLEVGATWRRFANQQLIPTGKTFGIDLPDRDQIAPDGRLMLGVEFRIIEFFVFSIRVGARYSLGSLSPLQFDAGAGVGVVL